MSEVHNRPVNRIENTTSGKENTAKYLILVTVFFHYQLAALLFKTALHVKEI